MGLSIDLEGIMQAIMAIVLIPALMGVMTSIAGVNLGPLSGLLQAFVNLLPIIVLLNVLGDLFKGVGGKLGSVFETIMNYLVLIAVFPALMAVIPGLEGFSSIFTIFQQLLPILVLFELLSSFFKK